MKLVTIPSPRYVNGCSSKLNQVVEAVTQVSGQQEKPSCWLKNTKLKVEDTKANGTEEITKVSQGLDKAEVEN